MGKKKKRRPLYFRDLIPSDIKVDSVKFPKVGEATITLNKSQVKNILKQVGK